MKMVLTLTNRMNMVKHLFILLLGRGHLNCIQTLIERGLDVNKKDHSGITPFHLAARFGFSECIELLIKNGANINEKDSLGRTPLYLAADGGHLDCVRIFIEYGANIDEKNNNGRTLFDCVRLEEDKIKVREWIEKFNFFESKEPECD